MGSRAVLITVLILATALPAGAKTLTADGLTLEPSHDYRFFADRDGLVEDGGFEAGTCQEGQSAWTCTSDNDCDWIADLVPLGLWNYEGEHILWLGGFCEGLATCYTSVCQDLFIDGDTLSWYWMAYLNSGEMNIQLTVDGESLLNVPIIIIEHILDYWQWTLDLSQYAGEIREICFVADNTAHCAENLGDNVFVDFVELVTVTGIPQTPVLPASISTIKSHY